MHHSATPVIVLETSPHSRSQGCKLSSTAQDLIVLLPVMNQEPGSFCLRFLHLLQGSKAVLRSLLSRERETKNPGDYIEFKGQGGSGASNIYEAPFLNPRHLCIIGYSRRYFVCPSIIESSFGDLLACCHAELS